MKNKVNDIIKVIENYYSLNDGSVHYKTRKREIVIARQLAHYFTREIYKKELSLADVGILIGGKDHATVLYSIKTINNLIDTDKNFVTQVKEIRKIIKQMINGVSGNGLVEAVNKVVKI
jgi:chromosomal replication initiator protein